MNIFLDDLRLPENVVWIKLPELPEGEHWTIVRSYNQFCDVIKRCMITDTPVERVCFDNDLADCHYGGIKGNEKDGVDCARVLADAILSCDWSIPKYVVHSMNGIRAKEIISTMNDIPRYRKAIQNWANAPHPWKRI